MISTSDFLFCGQDSMKYSGMDALFSDRQISEGNSMSVSVFEGTKRSWLELMFQSVLGWLQAFVGKANHSKASNNSNLSGLSANQKLYSPRFGFQNNLNSPLRFKITAEEIREASLNICFINTEN